MSRITRKGDDAARAAEDAFPVTADAVSDADGPIDFAREVVQMRRITTVLVALLLTLTMATGAVATYGRPGVTEDVSGNNLSVPTVFVPSVGVGNPTCTDGDDAIPPDPAQMSTAFPGYYIQGEASWQADCMTAAAQAIAAMAAWGDNLQSAPLKQGTPIRVEMALLADANDYAMTGFLVVKLTDELDRLATYGTTGEPINPYAEVGAWSEGATLKIWNSEGLVYDGPYTAEINSTGRIVYGYNWQKPVAGTYTIEFFSPYVGIASTDAGTLVDSDQNGTFDTVQLTVNVALSGGGGGGGGNGGGGHGGGPNH